MDATKKRKDNWTEAERLGAIEAIVAQSDFLFGKFRGATCGAKVKDACWQRIADGINSSGKTSCLRDVNQLKKMYQNCKVRAKNKIDSRRKTGGGPAPQMLPSEDVLSQHLVKNNTAQMIGICGGMESGDLTVNSETEEISTMEDTHKQQEISIDGYELQTTRLVGDAVISTFVPDVEKDAVAQSVETSASEVTKQPSSTSRPTKKRRGSTEANLYSLEERRMELEIEKLEKEINYINQKTKHDSELFELKKKNLNSSMNLFD